jgi:hypothetical protein
LWPFGCDDQLAALLTKIEYPRTGGMTGEHHDGERDWVVGENVSRPPIVLCQLHEIASRHQPSRQR